ncbi:MAG: DUF421 domain-containing protein [Flavisolibacter sp.]|nr:DUF421 domain-containing protein [Flavisolibacter sp.]
MKNIFFDSWESIIRTIVITVLAYALLIFLLRTSGKRTLSKMNAFDFIVTVALGSTLATVMLNKNVALIDGVLAFFLLIYLQYLITFLSARYRKISNLVKSTPSLIAYKGRLLKEAMLKERVNEGEVYAVIRENGLSSLEETGAIVLETDGSLTVIKEIQHPQSKTMTSLRNVQE